MSTANLGALPLRLSEVIRTAYREKHRQVFWPGQFVRAGLGPEDLVVASLEELVNRGELVFKADLRCPDGHSLRRVEARHLPLAKEQLTRECLACHFPQESEPTMRVWFELSPEMTQSMESVVSKKA